MPLRAPQQHGLGNLNQYRGNKRAKCVTDGASGSSDMGSGKRRPLTPCANVGFALMSLTPCMTEVGGADDRPTGHPPSVSRDCLTTPISAARATALAPVSARGGRLGSEDFRPPMRPSSASHSGPENTEERRPGTLRSRSRLSQCKPPPRPRISTARISLGLARLRLWYQLHRQRDRSPVRELDAQRVLLRAVHAVLARGSVFAARLPARDARAKFARSSFSIHRRRPGLSTYASEPNAWVIRVRRKCPKFMRNRLKELP